MDRDTKVIFIILAIILALGVFFVGKVVTKTKDEEKIENIENIENNKNNVVESVTSEAKHMELVTFNSQFTAFEGKEKNSISELRALENMINVSNMTNSTHQIEMILPNGYTEIDDLDKGKKYSIILEYDEQGYVNKVNVLDVD